MDQTNIIEGLQKALAGGSGSLDDLDKLMDRVKQDIAQAKKDEAAAKEKAKADRGNKVAQLATRILNSEMTDEDMAFVMNTFYAQKGLKETWTTKDIAELVSDVEAVPVDTTKTVTDAVNELADLFNKMFGVNIDKSKVKSEVKKDGNMTTVKAEYKDQGCKCGNKKDPDEVIKKFLKDFGL